MMACTATELIPTIEMIPATEMTPNHHRNDPHHRNDTSSHHRCHDDSDDVSYRLTLQHLLSN